MTDCVTNRRKVTERGRAWQREKLDWRSHLLEGSIDDELMTQWLAGAGFHAQLKSINTVFSLFFFFTVFSSNCRLRSCCCFWPLFPLEMQIFTCILRCIKAHNIGFVDMLNDASIFRVKCFKDEWRSEQCSFGRVSGRPVEETPSGRSHSAIASYASHPSISPSTPTSLIYFTITLKYHCYSW